MRLVAVAVLSVSLAVAGQTPAPYATVPAATTPAGPAKPVLHAPAKSTVHHSTTTKPVLPAPKIKTATPGTATGAAVDSASKGTHHYRVPAKPAARTARAAKPAPPKPPAVVAPAPAVAVAPAGPTPAPFSQNPIMQLRGNARTLLLFAPDSKDPQLKQQFALLAEHVGELSDRDTVIMPVVTVQHDGDDAFPGENLPSGTYRDQLAARQKFNVKWNEFAVILVDEDGNETFRSAKPLTIEELNAQLGVVVTHPAR